MNATIHRPFFSNAPASQIASLDAVGDALARTEYVVPSWYYWLSTAGMAAGAYHGYKRNDSVGWAIGWGLLGAMFPFITIPVSLAQGFGKRAGR